MQERPPGNANLGWTEKIMFRSVMSVYVPKVSSMMLHSSTFMSPSSFSVTLALITQPHELVMAGRTSSSKRFTRDFFSYPAVGMNLLNKKASPFAGHLTMTWSILIANPTKF